MCLKFEHLLKSFSCLNQKAHIKPAQETTKEPEQAKKKDNKCHNMT